MQAAASAQRAKLTQIADEDDVAGYVATGEKQLAAVAGPGKIEDQAGSKIRDLARRAARERLLPNVSRAVAGEDELNAVAGGRPVKSFGAAGNIEDVNGRSA